MIKIQEKQQTIGTDLWGIQKMEILNTGLKIILFGTFKDTKHKIESFSKLETRQEK